MNASILCIKQHFFASGILEVRCRPRLANESELIHRGEIFTAWVLRKALSATLIQVKAPTLFTCILWLCKQMKLSLTLAP
jgi:hypothetical protein